MNATKILIVEDDRRISDPLREDLQHQNYSVEVAHSGMHALALAERLEFDLVLLDVMLPELDGIEVCRTLRTRGFNGAVLMLTARMAKADKILGLDSGADDYIVKPFDIDELNARIRALLRRGQNIASQELKCGKLLADLRSCTVSYGGKPVTLTATEYRILLYLMRHPRQIFSKNQLIEALWVDGDVPTDTVIKAHIKALRQKLDQAGTPKNMIQTVYGFGYRLDAG